MSLEQPFSSSGDGRRGGKMGFCAGRGGLGLLPLRWLAGGDRVHGGSGLPVMPVMSGAQSPWSSLALGPVT